MGSRREYAITLGLAIPGRGRLSRAANIACDEAASNGMEFDLPLSALVKTPRSSKPKVTFDPKGRGAKKFVTNTAPVEEEEWNIQAALYPNDQMWKSETGKLVNGRTVCSPCGYSLQYHRCNSPKAVVSPGVLEAVVMV